MKNYVGVPQGVYLGPVGFLVERLGSRRGGGGRLTVVRPPRRVAGHGSHDAATLRAPFQFGFQVALAFAAASLFLLKSNYKITWSVHNGPMCIVI